MTLSEIVGMGATVDHCGRSEVADVAAAMWGLPAGEARFWRSSASHVFVVDCPAAETGRAYLRFVPESWRPRALVVAVAELMCQYSRAGLAVATLMTSVHGQLVETIPTARGRVHAMLVAEAPGRPIEVADLTEQRARAWGAALARLHCHEVGGRLTESLAESLGDLQRAAQVLADDRPIAGAVARLQADLDRLPRHADCFGIVHGDFELDNLAWSGDTATAYDFDEAGRSWFVADIAYALRDLQQAPTAQIDTPATAAFLTGYRTVRDLPGTNLTWLPLFTAAHAAAWLMRLPAILDSGPSPSDPPWLPALREKLLKKADWQRTLILANTPRM
jgi:Ser/Thr protein kinase RdoA (MazF antagonist)